MFEGDEVSIRKFFLDYFYEAQVVTLAILPTKKINEIAKSFTEDFGRKLLLVNEYEGIGQRVMMINEYIC